MSICDNNASFVWVTERMQLLVNIESHQISFGAAADAFEKKNLSAANTTSSKCARTFGVGGRSTFPSTSKIHNGCSPWFSVANTTRSDLVRPIHAKLPIDRSILDRKSVV